MGLERKEPPDLRRRCAYCARTGLPPGVRFVAVRCNLEMPLCRDFPLVAVRCNLPERTLNPKVAGSSPARPTSRIWKVGRFDSYSGLTAGASLLLAFFKSDPTTRPWFLAGG
jgi:hypothetical protein